MFEEIILIKLVTILISIQGIVRIVHSDLIQILDHLHKIIQSISLSWFLIICSLSFFGAWYDSTHLHNFHLLINITRNYEHKQQASYVFFQKLTKRHMNFTFEKSFSSPWERKNNSVIQNMWTLLQPKQIWNELL